MEKKTYERPIITPLNAGIPNKFGSKMHHEPVTEIDGVAVDALIQQYGSPLFVLSETTIRNTYKKAVRAFATRYPKVQFAWSYKTNYINAVCNVFHQEGSWAEVVSIFEYKKAIGNGVPGSKILFNGPEKSEADLTLAVNNGSMIHIDHLDELYMLANLAPSLEKRPKVAIRLNMDTGIYPMWDRFGFNIENGAAWKALQLIAQGGRMDLVGLHCHIGTFMMSSNAYAVAATKLASLASRLKETFNISLRYLDLGGGFPSRNTLKGAYLPGTDNLPTFDDFAEAICTALLDANLDQQHLPVLILETGRALVDEAGYLLGTVLANKRLNDGRRAMVMDAGVNLLFTSFWYEHKISPTREFSTMGEPACIFGPLCMNIDKVRDHVMLPPLEQGDHVVVHHVGAYNMTQWMQFIAMRPNVVMIDGNHTPHLIRRAETVEDLNAMESMPTHLSDFSL